MTICDNFKPRTFIIFPLPTKDGGALGKQQFEGIAKKLSIQQTDIQLFASRSELLHVDHVEEQKIKGGPITTGEITDIRLLDELYVNN